MKTVGTITVRLPNARLSGVTLLRVALLACAVGSAASAMAQAGIYTCVDGRGRRVTSDRPIPECADREQRELKSDGTTKRTIRPSLSPQEQVQADEKTRADIEARARVIEDKRKERALLSRYPNAASHNKERASALQQVDGVIRTASQRIDELTAQRKEIDTELEFYKKDPLKAPPKLRRRIEDNDSTLAVQKRFVADQEDEKNRVNARFDEELVILKRMWALQAGPVAARAASAPKP
jgi:Domain of unknown function (DUF4124)